MTSIPVRVEDLRPDDPEGFDQAVRVLIDAFATIGWPDDLEEARKEIRESLEPDRVSLVARDESGAVIGWIGGLHEYARVWELHPLAVAPCLQRRGVGRALVAALEDRVAALGGLTLRLGTDYMHLVETGGGARRSLMSTSTQIRSST